MNRAVCLLLALAVTQVAAQDWPSRPVNAVVPVGAGSSTDIVHRIVLEQLSVQLGQPVVVENRVGAGGTIGTAFVAKASPDGYVLLASGASHTIAPALYKALPFDPVRCVALINRPITSGVGSGCARQLSWWSGPGPEA